MMELPSSTGSDRVVSVENGPAIHRENSFTEIAPGITSPKILLGNQIHFVYSVSLQRCIQFCGFGVYFGLKIQSSTP